MNRSELAALISSTMHSSVTIRAPIHHPGPESNSQSRLPIPSCRSPRQEFQTRVKRLAHTRQSLSEADAEPKLRPKTPKSEDGPIPRPKHTRNYSYIPQARTPHVVTQYSHDGRKTRKSMAAQIEEEPDFVREEREAWARKSPKQPYQPALPHRSTEQEVVDSNGSVRRRSIILEPPKQSSAPPPQPRKQIKQTIPLRDFAPTTEQSNTEERPKTSRGAQPEPRSDSTTFYEENSPEISEIDGRSIKTVRTSKFLEGSLNVRSGAVASSWFDNGSVSEDSYDSDTTPRASRDIRQSSSFESQDSKALLNTPTTVKKRLFRIKSIVRLSENGDRSAEQQQPAKKKGLRKSLSTWNFHNLGDKMKIFGGSSNDLTPKATKENKYNAITAGLPPAELLDDRKRKAEEIYAKQFSLKKQKSNTGLATPTPDQSQPPLPKPSSLKRRTPSSSSYNSISSHHHSQSQRRRIPSSSTIASFTSDRSSSASEIDHRKRPSRKDLEKENQQLRAMLRKTSSSSIYQDPRRSSYHLPLEDESGQENQPRLTQQHFTQGNAIRLSPGKRMGRRGEDVPPMPQVPREVLGALQIGWNGSSISAGDGSGAGNGKGALLRSVSMITEEDDAGESNFTAEQLVPVQNRDLGMVREQWEWPDDVF